MSTARERQILQDNIRGEAGRKAILRALTETDELKQLRINLTEEQARLFNVLVSIYMQGYDVSAPLAVANVCDELLDRSGALLGKIRDAAQKLNEQSIKKES